MTVVSGLRFDSGLSKISKVKKTDEGFLTGSAAVARVGIMKYRLADGTIRREFVPPETLFALDSMNTLKLKPITNTHPPEKLVDSTSAGRRKVGATGETIVQDNDFLVSSLVVMDENAIQDIENGRLHLSPGYRCEVEIKSGVYGGDVYDAVQVKRIYNHIALVDNARGGPELKLNLDGHDITLDGYEFTESTNNIQRSEGMRKVILDGIEYEASAEVLNRLAKLEQERNDALESLKVEKAAHDRTKADFDTAKVKLDDAEKTIKNLPEAIAEGMKARLSLERAVTPYLDKEVIEKIDSLTDADLRKAVILKTFPEAKLDDKSVDYVNARFDSAIDIMKSRNNDNMASQRRSAFDNVKIDSCNKGADDARERMVKRSREAWKGEKVIVCK